MLRGGAVLIDRNGSTDGNTGYTVLVGPNDDPETETRQVLARGREFGDHIHDFGCFRRHFWGEIQKTPKTAQNLSRLILAAFYTRLANGSRGQSVSGRFSRGVLIFQKL